MTKKTAKKSPAPADPHAKYQYGIRMDADLKERIMAYSKRMQQTTGLEVRFSAAIRGLIEKGLEATAQT